MTEYLFAFKHAFTVVTLSFTSNIASSLKKLFLRGVGSIKESIHPSKEKVVPNLYLQRNGLAGVSGRSGKAIYTLKEGNKLEI